MKAVLRRNDGLKGEPSLRFAPFRLLINRYQAGSTARNDYVYSQTVNKW